MRRLLILIIGLFGVLGSSMWAQDDPEYRMEIGAGIGLLSYQGDFNSNLFGGSRPMASVIGKYVFNPYSGFCFSVSYGTIKGDAANEQTFYPDFNNDVSQKVGYLFKSTLVDVSLVYEYNFWPYGTGRDYRGAKRFTPFVFVGLGTTYAKCSEDIDGEKSSAFTMNFPLGVGVKYKLAERVNLGVQWAMHFSASDKLDGAVDPYGIKSSGLFKNTDCYSVLQAFITYRFSAKCRTCNKDI